MTNKLIIAALQIPAFGYGAARSMNWYEDYVLSNAKTFVENGITSIKIQDETVEPGPMAQRSMARMACLGHALKREFPSLDLGIIVQAHDPVAALAIADACGAGFVRLKVFAGAAVTAEGLREALGPEAVAYRERIGRADIRIYADVHDRTSVPTAPVPNAMAAAWTAKLGADALVVTGATFVDTTDRISAARRDGVSKPILIGGSVTTDNVGQALDAADGVIVSSALRRKGAAPDAMDRWDGAAVRAFMDAVTAHG
ncbi:MAG: BtpA/SgcQ family protein [Pseudomonadota bacterium]